MSACGSSYLSMFLQGGSVVDLLVGKYLREQHDSRLSVVLVNVRPS